MENLEDRKKTLIDRSSLRKVSSDMKEKFIMNNSRKIKVKKNNYV
jgi:hypothetical protein